MNKLSSLKPLAIVLISTLLTSCAAAIVAGAAASLVVYDRRSMRTLNTDSEITHHIYQLINRHTQFKHSRIIVTSFNRVVLLVGQVASANLKQELDADVRATAHVDRVYNELAVANPIPLSQRSKDTWITSQVRTAMLARKDLESGSIHIVTENGVVYLMGIVNLEQANLAVDVARRVNGVNKVVKTFQYIH